MKNPRPLVWIVDHPDGPKVFYKESMDADANGEDTQKVKRIVSADPKYGQVRGPYEARVNW